MKDYEIKYLRKKLMEEQQKVESQLTESKKNNFGVDDSIGNSIEELSRYDNHPADLATETFEQEKYITLRNQQLQLLADIRDALQRIDRGSYGICAYCGLEIGFERLEAYPTAKLCINCQKKERDEQLDTNWA
jgi:YteA family regulatory protein